MRENNKSYFYENLDRHRHVWMTIHFIPESDNFYSILTFIFYIDLEMCVEKSIFLFTRNWQRDKWEANHIKTLIHLTAKSKNILQHFCNCIQRRKKTLELKQTSLQSHTECNCFDGFKKKSSKIPYVPISDTILWVFMIIIHSNYCTTLSDVFFVCFAEHWFV